MVVRVGVPPKDLPDLVRGVAGYTDEVCRLVDVPNGHLYVRGSVDLTRLRREAVALGGYAVVVHAHREVPMASEDVWGVPPESADLMRHIKEQWDPAGVFDRLGF